jgi:hypothetical protein
MNSPKSIAWPRRRREWKKWSEEFKLPREEYLPVARVRGYRSPATRVWFFVAAMFGCVLHLAAQTSQPSDLTIVTRTTNGDFSSTKIEYLKGQRSRTESYSSFKRPAWNGGPMVRTFQHPRATIIQCDQHQQLALGRLTREYSATEIDDRGRPAQRLAPIQSAPSGGTITVTVETIDTGECKEFFGRTARHVITRQTAVSGPGAVSSVSQSESDGWYLDLDVNPGCGPRASAAVGVLTGSSRAPGAAAVKDKIEWKFIGKVATGLPVELTTRSLAGGRSGAQSRSTPRKSEITKLSTAPLDPALFDAPKGFTKVDRLNYQPSASLSSQAQVWWYMIKQKFPAIFR